VNRLGWLAAAKRWAAETWADLTAPEPVDPAEREAIGRARVRALLSEAIGEAQEAELFEVSRLLCAAREAMDEGLERRAGDRLLVLLGAERARTSTEARGRDDRIQGGGDGQQAKLHG